MAGAAQRMGRVTSAALRTGEQSDLAGWHRTFDPQNRFGLVMLNTHGGPTAFHLDNGPGQTADVPETAPAVVLMIHSFSAQDPTDPDTVGGRWLANGAYAYFGSVHEPFLQSFRTPGLVASFLEQNLPVVVAERRVSGEPFSEPWRLVYLGDPLYRLRPAKGPEPRAPSWSNVASWPSYREFRAPAPGDPESDRLIWSLKTSIYRLQTSARPTQTVEPANILLGIARDRLGEDVRPLYDDLLADALLQAGRPAELIDRLSHVEPSKRSPSVRRHLETAQTAALQRAMLAKDQRQALALWTGVVRAQGSKDFVRVFTERTARLADTSVRQAAWRNRLRAAMRDGVDPNNAAVIEAELNRVEGLLHPKPGKP
jgi:hypothetical protein